MVLTVVREFLLARLVLRILTAAARARRACAAGETGLGGWLAMGWIWWIWWLDMGLCDCGVGGVRVVVG